MNCHFCNATFKTPGTFRRHLLACEIKYNYENDKSLLIERQDIPCIQDIYSMLQTYIKKTEKLAEQVNKLEKYAYKEIKKITIPKWLLENINIDKDTKKWYDSIIVSNEDMENLLDYDFVSGILEILIREYQNCEDINKPIWCFEQKKHKIYYYTGLNWEIMDAEYFKSMIFSIHKKLLLLYKIYENNLTNDMKYGSNNKSYLANNNKIMGGGKMGKKITNIQKKFYESCKVSITDLINNIAL